MRSVVIRYQQSAWEACTESMAWNCIPNGRHWCLGDGEWDQYQERYSSLDEAVKGHERIVESVRRKPGPIPKRRFLEDEDQDSV